MQKNDITIIFLISFQHQTLYASMYNII